MPPARRRQIRVQAAAQSTDANSLANLRQHCAENDLPVHSRRATLINRLQQHASANASGTSSAGSSTIPQPASTPNLLSDAQLAQVQSIVTQSVEQSANEIAANAARAAVAAMTSSASATGSSLNHVILDTAPDETTTASPESSCVPPVFPPQAVATTIPIEGGVHA